MKLKDADKIKEAISRSYKALSLRGERYLSEDAIMMIIDEVPLIVPDNAQPLINTIMEMMPRIAETIMDNIPKAVEKVAENSTWIPIKRRNMTQEEKDQYCEQKGIKKGSFDEWDLKIYECEMPKDGQEILISTKYGVTEDTFRNDPEEGWTLEKHGDFVGVTAWMPKPKQYQEDSQCTIT